MNTVELQGLVGGALQEKFNKAFERVIENLQDQNTSFKVKRGITIKLNFAQNEARDDVAVTVDVTEKLAPQAGMKTAFYIGKDLKTGKVYAEEYGKQIRGQMSGRCCIRLHSRMRARRQARLLTAKRWTRRQARSWKRVTMW